MKVPCRCGGLLVRFDRLTGFAGRGGTGGGTVEVSVALLKLSSSSSSWSDSFSDKSITLNCEMFLVMYLPSQ